jgi:GT2 family glycosyltransferase
MKVSVIVCTKNREEHLDKCLSTIALTAYPYDELLVVDNGSDDSARKKNEELAARAGARYCYEGKIGLSSARNRGIREAIGDIIVYADDDFVVDREWLTYLVENYKEERVACCTGRMLSNRSDESSRVFEEAMSFDRGERRRVFSPKDIGIHSILRAMPAIGNKRLFDRTPVPWAIGRGFCSFRKSIFDEVGYFDERLGAGTPTLGGEEVDMFYRVLKAGYFIVYEPRAVIYHDHRATLEQVVRQAYCAGASDKAFLTKYRWKDPYLTLCHLGTYCWLVSGYLKALLKKQRWLRTMIGAELRGFHRRVQL